MLDGWWPGRRIATAAAIAGAVFVLLLVAVLAAGRGPTVLDGSITPHLQVWALADDGRWGFFRTVTRMGERVFTGIVEAALFFYCLHRQRVAVAAWVAVCGITYPMLNSLMKVIVARPRPMDADPDLTYQEASFPSGHSGAAMTLTLLLILVVATSVHGWRRLLTIVLAVAISVLVGASRMALGVHYPTDVLAAFCLALVWAALTAYAVKLVSRRFAWNPAEPDVVQ